MKILYTFILILISAFSAFCQDTLVKKSGEEIQVKVLEITPDLVKYKNFNNLEGPTISVYKRDVFMVRYAGGAKEIFTPMPAQPQPAPIQTLPNAYKPTPVAEGRKFEEP